MDQLATSGRELLWAAWHVVVALATLAGPYVPLAVWTSWWLFAVDWTRFRRVLVEQGGWIAVVLLGFATAAVWSFLAPIPGGVQRVAGLEVSNLVGKIVSVTGWIVIAWVSGAIQLATAREPVRLSQAST